jgi:hypothetical protein
MTTTRTEAAGTANLLFINKDATSVSLSQPGAGIRRTINRHVQHWYQGTKFVTQQRALRDSPAFRILVGESGRTTKTQERVLKGIGGRAPASQSHKASNRGPKSEVTRISSDALELQPTVTVNRQLEREDTLTAGPAAPSLPPLLCSKGDSVDPFSCTATPIDHTTHDLLQHYMRVIVPATFHVEAQAYRSTMTRHAVSTFEVVRRSMSSEMHMAALLTVSAYRVTHVVKKDLVKNNAEFFMCRAIRALREHLRSISIVVDQATILDSFWLFQAESYCRNYDVSMVHLRIVRQLVEAIGGLGVLD